MTGEPLRVDLVEKVVVVLGKKPVGVDHQLLSRSVHLHLSLLQIGLCDREPLAFVGLYLVDDIVLPVEIHAESDAVLADPPNPNLTVSLLDPEVVEDTMLIGGTRRRVLVPEVVLGETQLHAPPLGEGVGLPIPHDGGRITRSDPARS